MLVGSNLAATFRTGGTAWAIPILLELSSGVVTGRHWGHPNQAMKELESPFGHTEGRK
jgi:hypothetical protein